MLCINCGNWNGRDAVPSVPDPHLGGCLCPVCEHIEERARAAGVAFRPRHTWGEPGIAQFEAAAFELALVERRKAA